MSADLPTMPQSAGSIAEILAALAEKGLTICIEGARTFVYSEKAKRRQEARRLRNQRHRAKRKEKAALNRLNASQMRLTPSTESGNYHGLTWRHMPGKTEFSKKCSFSEFKRGQLPGYESCRGLEGRAMRDEFARVKAERKASAMRGSRKELAKQPD